jgi:hypothetical protein
MSWPLISHDHPSRNYITFSLYPFRRWPVIRLNNNNIRDSIHVCVQTTAHDTVRNTATKACTNDTTQVFFRLCPCMGLSSWPAPRFSQEGVAGPLQLESLRSLVARIPLGRASRGQRMMLFLRRGCAAPTLAWKLLSDAGGFVCRAWVGVSL